MRRLTGIYVGNVSSVVMLILGSLGSLVKLTPRIHRESLGQSPSSSIVLVFT